MVEEALVLDRDTFKSLSSDTRVKILKLLEKRRHTLSEISKELGISLANAKEHLEKLLDSELISLKDEGRKWKYYELTRKGKKLVNSSSGYQKIVVVLAAAFIGLTLSLYWMFSMLGGVGAPAYEMAEAPRFDSDILQTYDGGPGDGAPEAMEDAGGTDGTPMVAATYAENKSDGSNDTQATEAEDEANASVSKGTERVLPPLEMQDCDYVEPIELFVPVALSLLFALVIGFSVHRLWKKKKLL